MNQSPTNCKIRIFTPCYGLDLSQVRNLTRAAREVHSVAMARGFDLRLLLVNDQPDNLAMSQEVELALSEYPFIEQHRHAVNSGNAAAIKTGYKWVCQFQDDSTPVFGGCLDSDGEHDPRSFLPLFDWLIDDQCDEVLSSIDYPEHTANTLDQRADLAMMRFLEFDQSALLELAIPNSATTQPALIDHNRGFSFINCSSSARYQKNWSPLK